MGKILAFVHFLMTEMRIIWLLWYTVYSTFKTITTTASISDVYSSYEVRKCLYEEKITVGEIEDCMTSAYQEYLAHGPQLPYKYCSEECPESEIWITAPEPRNMFFFMTVWLFGFLLALLVYFIYRHPDYHTGSYIKFTQTLYASKVYKFVANCTFVICVLVILLGIYILIREGKAWTQFIVALLLMVMASRSLVFEKSNGVNINSEQFCRLEISRGNALMKVIHFFLTTNAVLLDEMEVQLMNNGLPDGVAAAVEPEKGCLASLFAWYPLSDQSIEAFLPSKNENSACELTEVQKFESQNQPKV